MEIEENLRQECIKRCWLFPERTDTPEIRSEKRGKIQNLLEVGCVWCSPSVFKHAHLTIHECHVDKKDRIIQVAAE